MKKLMFMGVACLCFLTGCGKFGANSGSASSQAGSNSTVTPATRAGDDDASTTADEMADIALNADNGFALMQVRNAPGSKEPKTKTIEGETGTLEVSLTSEVDEGGKTRTRTLKFTNYTGNGAGRKNVPGEINRSQRRLSNINGTITYVTEVMKEDGLPASVKRRVDGEINATVVKKDTSTFDATIKLKLEFTHDPETKCKTLVGEVIMKNSDGEELFNKAIDKKICRAKTDD